MPKYVYKKGADKELHEVGILPSIEEWDGKSNVGHTHAIITLNTNNSSIFPVSYKYYSQYEVCMIALSDVIYLSSV